MVRVHQANRRVEYGQNFLHNRRLVARLVGRAEIGDRDVVLEIGPGHGILTEALAKRCAHVIAVEKDPLWTRELQRRFAQQGNVTVFAADFLDFPLPATEYKVFASIPYNITAAIVGKLTTGVAPPRDCYLIMQAEAAAKLVGQPRQTLAGLNLYPAFACSIEHSFRRDDFRPAPAVDSVLLRIHRRDEPMLPAEEMSRYQDVVTALFTAWQPSLREAWRMLLPGPSAAALNREFTDVMACKPGDVPAPVWLAMYQRLREEADRRIWRKIDGAAERLARQQAGLQKQHRSRTSDRR